MIGHLLSLRYELLAELDPGPIFRLFRAMDRQASREVFVRLLAPPFDQDSGFVEQLGNTVRSLSTVQSQVVERFVHVTESEGHAFVVSDGPGGQSLFERIQRLAPYSVPVCISLALQTLEALQAVHEAGFAHGELTTHQVLVGGDGRVGLLGAGLWMSYGANPSAGVAAMQRLGPYLAPEISQGKMPSPISDLYAVGVILFELLTARHPFSDDSMAGLARKHATAPIPNLRQLNPQTPPFLEEIIRKAMSKDPAVRYPTSRAMMADLRALQEALRHGKQPTWPLEPAPQAGVTPAPGAPADPKPVPQAKPSPAPVIELPKPEPAPKGEKQRKDPSISERVPAWVSLMGYACALMLLFGVSGWVYWNLTSPPQLKVPNVVGKKVKDAEELLKQQNLTLKVARTEYNDKPKGLILELSPKPGQAVRENSFVAAVVSGGPRFVKVPELRGDTVETAAAKLGGLSLRLSDNVEEVFRRTQKEGTIVEQIPEPGSEVERSTKVRVTVASRRNRRSNAERVRAEYELVLRMPPGVQPLYVRVDLVDADGTRTVFPETLLQSEEVRQVLTEGRGTSVDFKVFFNGTLVKQVTRTPDGETE